MNIWYSAGKTYPVDHSAGTPTVIFGGWYNPLVPTNYRRASKLRIRATVDGARKDYALLDGHIFDFNRIISAPIVVDGNLVFKRFNGETVAVIPLIRE